MGARFWKPAKGVLRVPRSAEKGLDRGANGKSRPIFRELPDDLQGDRGAAGRRGCGRGAKTILSAIADWPDYPQHHGKLTADAEDDAVRKFTYGVLADRKGDGYAAQLIECCQSLAELPKTMTEFLQRVNALLKLSPLDGDDDEDDEVKPE